MTSEDWIAQANTALVRESVEAFNAGDTNKLHLPQSLGRFEAVAG